MIARNETQEVGETREAGEQGFLKPPTIRFNLPGQPASPSLTAMACPNCGGTAPKPLVLTIDLHLLRQGVDAMSVLRCPDCTAHFYDRQITLDYAEPALIRDGHIPFYVQQNAGVSLITRPLAQLRHPPGSTYMEVGCGFGFGLDFAIRTRGWDGVGIDPAPLSGIGRDALGLSIELRYLRDDDEARGTRDVVMGSEVIEHVNAPIAFVRTLRAMLNPGGVLVLTTPNGDDIGPETPPGILIPLLSPSTHLIIQNRHSLAALLHQAGFANVEVDVDSHSLVAFASDAPLDLERDESVLRLTYRRHLLRRAGEVGGDGDVFLGFAGRAFCESVNDGDMATADQAWAMLLPACRARFGFSLDDMVALPAGAEDGNLLLVAQAMPLSLAGLLYLRGIRRLAAGAPRPVLEAQFLLAAAAARAVRRALNALAMEDGQTEDVGWTASAEAILCAAVAGGAGVARRLAELPVAPNGGAARRHGIVLRTLSALVNAGHYAEARGLLQELALDSAPFAQQGAPLDAIGRDALFCLAVLDVQVDALDRPVGRPALARTRFARVRAACEPGAALWEQALRGEAQALRLSGDQDGLAALAQSAATDAATPAIAQWAFTTLVNAGRYDTGRSLAGRAGLAVAAWSQPGINRPMSATERDVVFCLAVLDVQAGPLGRPSGEPAMARGRFTRVRQACAAGDALWLGALRGELQALDMLDARDEAAALTADIEAAHPAVRLPPDILARIGKG